MPPRGSEGLDFTPVLTHYLFLFTSILSFVRFSLSVFLFTHYFTQIAWFLAFISQCIVTAEGNVPHRSITEYQKN